MDIIPNGTIIEVIGNEIKGTVIEASIAGINNPHIMYKVVWWAGGSRHEEWLESYEIEVYVDNSKQAGMVNYETDLKTSGN